jgi:hypothetical protein
VKERKRIDQVVAGLSSEFKDMYFANHAQSGVKPNRFL